MMFSGLRSRCTTPIECAVSRTLITGVRISRASSAVNRPRRFQLCIERMTLEHSPSPCRSCRLAWCEGRERLLSLDGEIDGRPGLRDGTDAAIPVVSHLRRQDFDGDTIAKQNVARTIHRTHSAFAEHRLNVVLAVENSVYKRRRILFQNLAINRAEGDAVFVFCCCRACSISFGAKNRGDNGNGNYFTVRGTSRPAEA